jgi:catechol 2,3-dioxygenase-like lactoylglutathione lyase family enzyme
MSIRKIPTQGVHHITLVGADRATSLAFWEGMLGMPFVFEQPNLDAPDENHLYFDPGDGRLITVFTHEGRRPNPRPAPSKDGSLHHLAFTVSQAVFAEVAGRLDARGIPHSGPQDRGFMDSIYFRDPMGTLIELASYRFEPPEGMRHVDVLMEAHRVRVARGDAAIARVHVADALENLVASRRESLSEDRGPQDPYARFGG